ncbi:hypothetical protein Tco_0040209 [Tanacetum coccineum]
MGETKHPIQGQRVDPDTRSPRMVSVSAIPGCVTCGQGGTDSLIDHSLELGISDISGCGCCWGGVVVARVVLTALFAWPFSSI